MTKLRQPKIIITVAISLAASFLPQAGSAQDLPATVAPLRPPAEPAQLIPFGVPVSKVESVKSVSNSGLLTLSGSLDSSLAQSPRMSGVRALLGVARANYFQASVLPNPGIYIANNYGNSYNTGVSIPVEPPWKLVFRLLIAKRQVEQTKLEIARSLWQFRAEVRRTYVAYATAKQTLVAREQMHSLSEKIVASSQTQYDKGSVPKLDVHRAQLARIQAKMDLEQASIALAQAREQLNFVMGRDPDAALNTPALLKDEGLSADFTKGADFSQNKGELLPDFTRELPSRAVLVTTAQSSRLELKIARAAIATNTANLRNAYGNVLPTPRFVTGRVIEANPPTGPKTRNGFFQAYIDAPIFNVNQGDIARFKAMEKQLKLDLSAQENQVAGQVSLAYHKVLAARQRLHTFMDEALPEAGKVSSISRHGYELGQLDLNTVLDAQRAAILTQSQFFDAVLNYQLAVNDLEQATGAPLL